MSPLEALLPATSLSRVQSALCHFLQRPGRAGGKCWEEVPAFLDQGYFCDSAELTKQLGSLRSKGFPDLSKQLCHRARRGESQFESFLENVDVNKQTFPVMWGQWPRLDQATLPGPSCLFSWDPLSGRSQELFSLAACHCCTDRHTVLSPQPSFPGCPSRGALQHTHLTVRKDLWMRE